MKAPRLLARKGFGKTEDAQSRLTVQRAHQSPPVPARPAAGRSKPPEDPAEVRRRTAETKLAEVLAVRRKTLQAQPAMSIHPIAGGDAAAALQMKKTIEGSQHFAHKGELAINMEERAHGSSGGAYGFIRFTPYVNSGTDAEAIDLIQIASMTSNKRGQAKYLGMDDPGEVEEEHKETSGKPAVKDLWRTNAPEKYHMDLTGKELKPRSQSSDPVVEQAYNSERRGGRWKDPFDTVTMGQPGGPVLNEYLIKTAPNTQTFKISQDPGYRKGTEIRPAELHDYPQGPEPAAFSFHTTVDADGEPWGTVKWGFTTILSQGSEEIQIDTVQGPTFEAKQTPEMEEARRQFDKIMANPSRWSSPEALEQVQFELDSPDDEIYNAGIDHLYDMANDLLDVFTRIDETTNEKIFKKFVRPHLRLAFEVLDLMSKHGVEDVTYRHLNAACQELKDRYHK